MTKFVDFAELKSRVSIEDVIGWLGIELKRSGEQLRGACPIHQGTNERQFVVTPAKDLFKCFATECGAGGDQIALVAAMKQCSLREAALLMEEALLSPKTAPGATKLPEGGLDYLQPEHELVQGLGLTKDQAQRLGIGYAPKGVLRGRVCFPMRSEDGTLLGYCGYSEKLDPILKMPVKWL